MKTINSRTTEYEVEDIFLKRHSPRAMSGEAVSKEELMTLFDAARWAPSASNIQPWRFIYAMRDTPEFATLLSVLVQFNQDWCIRAGALILVISEKTRTNHKGEKKENTTHSFDTGAAWENLALQATQMGLVSHGMAGLDYAKAKTELNIPDDYKVEMMIAVGKPGKVEDLPEAIRAGKAPSDRKPLSEIVFKGKFPS